MKRRLESAGFEMFWQLGSYATFDEVLLKQLSEFDFRKIQYGWKIRQEDVERFFKNVRKPGIAYAPKDTHLQILDTTKLAKEDHATIFFTALTKTDSQR